MQLLKKKKEEEEEEEERKHACMHAERNHSWLFLLITDSSIIVVPRDFFFDFQFCYFKALERLLAEAEIIKASIEFLVLFSRGYGFKRKPSEPLSATSATGTLHSGTAHVESDRD